MITFYHLKSMILLAFCDLITVLIMEINPSFEKVRNTLE